MQSKITLYYPYSEIKDFDGHDKVCISWFCYNRNNPVASYDQLIQDFNNIEDNADAKHQIMAINEYLTYDEMSDLKNYLQQHELYSKGNFGHNQIFLPYRKKQAPLTTIPKANKRHALPIYQSDGDKYNLNFKAVGFYLEGYSYPFCKTYEPGKAMYKLYHNSVPV